MKDKKPLVSKHILGSRDQSVRHEVKYLSLMMGPRVF